MRPNLTGAWVCLTLAACADAPDRQVSHTVTDSAGIEIVHSSGPAWGEAERWSVDSEPYLEIGTVDGEEPYVLERVVGVARLEDGRVAVAMGADNTIRFYDSDGRYLDRVGGSGEGPGEFTRLGGLLRTPGRLYGRQRPSRPINVYDERSGAHLATISPPSTTGSGSGLVGSFDDGSLLFRIEGPGEMPPSGTFSYTATLIRAMQDAPVSSPAGEAASLDTLGMFPARTFVRMEAWGASAQEFGPKLEFAAAGDRLYRGHSSRWEIAEQSLDGGVVRLIRRDWEPVPVTAEDIAHRNEQARSAGADDASLDAMIFPDHHPAFGTIQVDRAGNLWVQRPDPARTLYDEVMGSIQATPASWDVFGADGVWLGTVEQPDRFQIREIGDDYMAGVWEDELGVEYVRFYEIVKPSRD